MSYPSGEAVMKAAAALSIALLVAGCFASSGGAAGGAALAQGSSAGSGSEAGGAMFDTAAGDYLAARQADEDGDTKAAAKFMSRALARDPGNVDLLRETFHLLLVNGDMNEAARMAHRVVAALPDNQTAQTLLALEEAKAGRWSEAEERIAKLPRIGLATLTVPLLEAWLFQGAGKTDAALKALDELSSAHGFAVLQSFHSGLINELAGRKKAAEADYRQAMTAEQKPSLRIVEALASFYTRSGRFADAAKAYDQLGTDDVEPVRVEIALKAIKRKEPLPPLVHSASSGLAEALFDVGSALREDTGTEVAIQILRMASLVDPGLMPAKTMLAELVEANQPDDALALYRSVPKSSPLYFRAQLRIADLLHTEDKFDQSIKVLDALSAAWPDRPEPDATAGDYYRGAEKYAEAIKAYDRAIARVPQLKPADWSLLYARGVAYERNNQWPPAERDFLDALKLSPDQPNVLNYLGYSWVDRGTNLDRAQTMIERAVQLRPNDGYIVDSLGWVLYRKGDFKRAVTDLERAVELKPDDAVINDHLGDAYWRVGRELEARYQWQRALSLKPDPDLTRSIDQKLAHGLKAVKAGEHDS